MPPTISANAYMLPEEDSRPEEAFNSAAQEAVQLGEILLDVAQTLAEDEELSAEVSRENRGKVKGAHSKMFCMRQQRPSIYLFLRESDII